MDNSVKMARLLGRLKVEMNGAVAEAMEQRGITYPLNYGVSLPTIRSIAADFAPDHSLARLLYRQQVRELKLAALIVAEPACVTTADMDFWAAGIENTEVAENLAILLGGENINAETLAVIAGQWLSSENDLVRYTALLSLARQVANRKDTSWLQPGPPLEASLSSVLCSPNRYVWQGVVALLSRLAAVKPETGAWIKNLARQAEAHNPSAADYLKDELLWQIE